MNCEYCTFSNPPKTRICAMCFKSLTPLVADVIEDSNGIQCDACTFINSSQADICEVCGSDLYIDTDNADDDESLHEELSGFQMEDPVTTKHKVSPTNETIFDCPRRECEICYEAIGSDYFAMFECIHTFCRDCAVRYFTIRITQRPILDCICPMCNIPDLRSTNGDKHEEYFSLLLASLRPILDENIINVFEKKLTELALLSDPNFVWCIRCTSGFVNGSQTKVIYCPDCRVKFCFQCKKKWKSQHQTLTCEQFANWQRDNDPKLSSEAIENYLQKNGIDCPKCKFKYDLSRGGCIHFTCTQCKYEFCFGCSKPFLRTCNISSYCKQVGLHAHHQRNCFYYLRDKTIADLQGLLMVNKIKFMVDTSESAAQSCPIELQIETGNSIVDTICNEPVEVGHAGLCAKHYKEYLIVTITKEQLETNPILTVPNYHELLRFQGIAIPAPSVGQKDSEYKDVCAKVVKNNIPLKR